MKSWLLVSSLLISTAFSELINRSDGYVSKVVRVPFKKERQQKQHVDKRQYSGKTVYQKLDNKDFLFYANVSVGTPPQPVRLHIDTGSSDIWVETAKSSICQKSQMACSVGGTYDNSSSKSYEHVPGEFAITYVDGQYANGGYAKDIIEIGGVAVENIQFGIGYEGTSDEGVLGLGFEARQSGTLRGQAPYPGLVAQMVDQGLINSRVYSVWLNDLNAEAGEILFGGLDTAKFHPPLTTIPLSRRQGLDHASDFVIMLKGITMTDGEGVDNTLIDASTPVLLDTGASFTYLPTDIADQLVKLVGAKTIPEYKGPAVNCTKRSIEGSINFNFGGITIKVKLSDFIIDATEEANDDFSVLCYLGILGAAPGSVLTLGDTFLRSAYVVYDMDNENISLAPTVFNSTDSNVVEIGSGATAIPTLSVADAVTTGADGVVETGMPNPNATTTGSQDGGDVSSMASLALGKASTALFTTFLISILSIATFL